MAQNPETAVSPAEEALEEAVEGYPCESCGAALRFEPGTLRMKCPYCGTENDIGVAFTAGEEHRLEDLPLQAATEKVGLGKEVRRFRCDRCGAVVAVEPETIATQCPYCGSDAILEAPSRPEVVRPTALVPFAIDEEDARDRYRGWLGTWWRRLLSPGDLRTQAAVTKIRGIYGPFFTFDAQAESDWSGFRGDYYYVTVGSGKNRRTVRKVRWTYRSGHHSHFYDDVLVHASNGLEESTLREIMPYDTKRLVPFKGEFLAGFGAEEYTRDPEDLWESARSYMQSAEWRACRWELGGDTYRNLRVRTRLEEPTWKHVLLPLYVASYVYGSRTYRFMVNGQTGEVQGSAPLSWAKVGLLAGAVIAAVAAAAALLGLF